MLLEYIINELKEYIFFAPKDINELKEAVDLYCENKKEGIKKYGLISYWDVSNVANMSDIY